MARDKLKRRTYILRKHQEGSIIVVKRKILNLGGSYALTIPAEWVRRQGLDVGSEVGIIANSILKVVAIPEI